MKKQTGIVPNPALMLLIYLHAERIHTDCFDVLKGEFTALKANGTLSRTALPSMSLREK
jgi:hypothetical protein